jgi:hypothetical protein
MPWTFYNSSGQRLSSASTSAALLDIDGGLDEMGAPIVDADLLIIDDADGGNKSVLASRIKTFIGSAISRAGGNTSVDTWIDTSAADGTATGATTIPALSPMLIITTAGKDATGSGNHVNVGIKANSTVIGDAVIGNNNLYKSSNVDEDQEGGSFCFVGPRLTGLQHNATGVATGFAGTTRRTTTVVEDAGGLTNEWIVVEITSLTLRVISNSPVGRSDEWHIYEYATS